MEDSFHRNQRLEATTDDDIPPSSRPYGGTGIDPAERYGDRDRDTLRERLRIRDAVHDRPGELADSSSEERSSRLTIEQYLMSDLRLPVSTGLDQYATSSFIRSPNDEETAGRGKATRQARRQALAENVAREKSRRRQPPPTGRLKKPPPSDRELKRLTRDRPWAEPPKRVRPSSAPASRPPDFVIDRTAGATAHAGPASAREHRMGPSVSAPRSRQASARVADRGTGRSDPPVITMQLKTARDRLREQAGQINRLQKETNQKDRVIAELKEQVKVPRVADAGRFARLAKKHAADRVTESKTARETISKLKGDLKEARKRALRAEAAVAASQRELKKAKETRVSSAKQLRASLAAETAKRQRAEEELKAARSDISKLTRQLRAEERKCSSLQAELAMERQRRMALLELSKKHGLDVKRRGSNIESPQPHRHRDGRDDAIRGTMVPGREDQTYLPTTPGGSLLSELRDRRLGESQRKAGSMPGASGGDRGVGAVNNGVAPDMAEVAAHVVEARGRLIARQQEEEVRVRAQKSREAEGRAESLRWAAARSAAEDPSLAGGLGGTMLDETAATLGARRFRTDEESRHESFTPLVVKHAEMQKLMTRLRDQAVKKQQYQNQTTTTETTTADDVGVATRRAPTDISSASSGLNISVGLAAAGSTGAGEPHRRLLSSYRPVQQAGDPGAGSGSSSSSDFAYAMTSAEQAKAKARLAGIKTAVV